MASRSPRPAPDRIAAQARPGTLIARRKIFEEARSILIEELGSDLRLTELASRLATSPRQLQRAFAEGSGASFSEYLTQLRMRKAARLLAAESTSVASVARAVGYGTRGQFSRAFSRWHGVTPGRFRRVCERWRSESARRASASAEDASFPPREHLEMLPG